MGNSLTSVKNDLKDRFEDIDDMMKLLNRGGNVDQQLILKSSMILMLYNAVEGVISNLLSELFDQIIQHELSIENLPNSLQDTIYSYYVKKIAYDSNSLKEFYNYDNITICKLSYLELNKYLKLFSGNLDSKEIRNISCRLGIDLDNFRDEPVLYEVKILRNRLAHGEVKFHNACQDITLQELYDKCGKVKEYLQRLIERYEAFVDKILKKGKS